MNVPNTSCSSVTRLRGRRGGENVSRPGAGSSSTLSTTQWTAGGGRLGWSGGVNLAWRGSRPNVWEGESEHHRGQAHTSEKGGIRGARRTGDRACGQRAHPGASHGRSRFRGRSPRWGRRAPWLRWTSWLRRASRLRRAPWLRGAPLRPRWPLPIRVRARPPLLRLLPVLRIQPAGVQLQRSGLLVLLPELWGVLPEPADVAPHQPYWPATICSELTTTGSPHQA
jgi:hypothetical protein